ncbi:DUF998 domain-containing protein [Streptomyces sp. NPDC000410]|uniref:DUF998 domain-containing protein n=1 Tax=Streptomyces sp. NPDC000410 TaxID=3154254 RepID=UPI003333D43B
MAHTLGAAHHATHATTSPRPAARGLLAGGLVAGPLFLAVGVTQGLTRDGFDFTRNAISQLALGDLGWIQTVNFVVTAALFAAGAIGLRRVLRGEPGGVWGPLLVGVFGASFLAAAVFPADAGAGFPVGAPDATSLSAHGAAHMAGGMVGYLALCAAFLVLARPLSSRGHRGWAVASRIAPVGVLAGFVGSSASVLAFTAGAGLGLAWLTAVTARLLTDTEHH